MTQITLPANKLARLLILNQIMLCAIEGAGAQDEALLTTPLKDILSPKISLAVSAAFKDFDDLYVAHLVSDLINITEEVAEYLPYFMNSSVVELESLQ